ncbi:MAG: hypothetical protein QM756_47530 [Polyangiaceae bacterium]
MALHSGRCRPTPHTPTGKLGLDLEATFPGDTPNAEHGWGGGLRFGNEWNLVLVKFTPEIMGNYHAFGGDSEATQWGVMAGGRVGVGLLLQPSVFAHGRRAFWVSHAFATCRRPRSATTWGSRSTSPRCRWWTRRARFDQRGGG